jgi:hypothetical protein
MKQTIDGIECIVAWEDKANDEDIFLMVCEVGVRADSMLLTRAQAAWIADRLQEMLRSVGAYPAKVDPEDEFDPTCPRCGQPECDGHDGENP